MHFKTNHKPSKEKSTKYPGKLMSSLLMKNFLIVPFENAYMNLMTLYKRSNYTKVIFECVSTILPHGCFLKQACKSYFIPNLENTQNPRDNKG
jgi:hypothetical protein